MISLNFFNKTFKTNKQLSLLLFKECKAQWIIEVQMIANKGGYFSLFL